MCASGRSGSVLIEVMVALVVLAVSGTALITLLGQTAHSMRSTLESERLARAASDELARLAITPREELAAAVGRAATRGWSIQLTAVSPDLFEVTIAQSSLGAPLLRTTFYRPDSSNARQ